MLATGLCPWILGMFILFCDTRWWSLLCVVDGERVGEVPQTEHSAGAQHQGAHTETEGHR